MGCASSRENDLNASRLVGSDQYRDDDAEAATAAFVSRQGLGSRVALRFWCYELRVMDRLSKSDPFLVLKMKTTVEATWREIGRTEIVSNSQSPAFTTQLQVTFLFEELQQVRVEVYDADSAYEDSTASSSMPLARQDFQGYVETTMANIVGAEKQVKEMMLLHPKTAKQTGGLVAVAMEEVAHQHDLVELHLRAQKVDKKDLSSSDPFLKISRMVEHGHSLMVFKSEVQRRTLNPTWRPIQGTMQQLANGDKLHPLQVDCYDYDFGGGHDFIGGCEASIADFQKISRGIDGELPQKGIALVNPNKLRKSGYENSGVLMVDRCCITPRPSFLDYIAGGTEISFIVAIDFTASNGNPLDPRSLHYLDPTTQLNPYAAAISGIGNVLEFYDTDKRFPVYGFGGKLGSDQETNHCFAVNGQGDDPEVIGIRGVLEAYYECLKRVQLSGPTLFQGVIGQAAGIAMSSMHKNPAGQKYFVLCIITDGIINDMNVTIDTIIQASSLPLSIVIVGVGEADFKAMERLDGDRNPLVSPTTGLGAMRDMVQFVPFREFDGIGVGAQYMLAKHVLAEVPGQFLAYMNANNIPPVPQGTGGFPAAGLGAPGFVDTPGGYANTGTPELKQHTPGQQQQGYSAPQGRELLPPPYDP